MPQQFYVLRRTLFHEAELTSVSFKHFSALATVGIHRGLAIGRAAAIKCHEREAHDRKIPR